MAETSLQQQISNTEQRLVMRRALSAHYVANIQQGAINKLVSPVGLLVAVGVGFSVGQCTQKNSEQKADQSTGTTTLFDLAVIVFIPLLRTLLGKV
jgi:invasion protein IalB